MPRKLTCGSSFCNVGRCKTQNLMEHLGDLTEKFKENNLPKASFLKLLAKAKPSRIF